MVSCCIVGCKSRNTRQDHAITFHSYPVDIAVRKKWTMVTGRANWQPTKYSRVCSKHFEPHCFGKHKSLTAVIKGSIPMLFLPVGHENTSYTSVTMPDISDTKMIKVEAESSDQETPPPNPLETEFVSIREYASPHSEVTRTATEPAYSSARNKLLVERLQKKIKLAAAYRREILVLKARNYRLLKKNKDLEELIELYILSRS